MTEKYTLKSESRGPEEKSPELRRNGWLPGVVYGAGLTNRSVKLKRLEFEKVFGSAGESSLITLMLDGKEANVLVKDVQHSPLKGEPTHVDFYEVDMKKQITAEVPLEFTGIAPAVIDLSGTLVKNRESLEVECLPGDLPSHLVVDLSTLTAMDSLIRASDIVLPKGVAITGDPEEVIIGVSELQKEEVAPVAAPVADAAAPEGAAPAAEPKKE
jgi:large subunit ribosomal protein L25